MTARKTLTLHRSRGFSLIELIVVIGIIIVLVGLVVGVATALRANADTNRTANVLQLLEQALFEWETASARQLTFGVNGQPAADFTFDIQQNAIDTPVGTTDDFLYTRHLIDIIRKNSAVRGLIANIDGEFLKKVDTTDPFYNDTGVFNYKLVDSWDKEVIAVFPGRLWSDVDPSHHDAGQPKDTDGTIRTELEDALGACANRKVRFVSAGPDGKFGDLSQNVDSDLYKAALDNVLSYPLEVQP